MEQAAINLTLVHEWMTVAEARLLLHDAYMRYRSQKRFFGWKNVETLIGIDYGIWQRTSEEHLRAKLDLLKSKYQTEGVWNPTNDLPTQDHD